MDEQVEQKTNKNLSTSSKSTGFTLLGSCRAPGVHEGLGAAMVAELMIGFWLGIGVILAIKMVQSLEYCIEELMSRK